MRFENQQRRAPGNPAALVVVARATAYLASIAALVAASFSAVYGLADFVGHHAVVPSTSVAKAPAVANPAVEHRVLQEDWFRSLGSTRRPSASPSAPPPRFDRSQRSNLTRPPDPPPFTLFGGWGDGDRDRRYWDDYPPDNARKQQQPQYRTYRTVCVRLCDGFYFPISFAATRDRFARDEAACQSSCGSAAKLYVYRNPGEDPDQMVDLRGQPYAKLKTAFLYRTSYDESCKCRPHAWEQVSMDRHRLYALEARRKKGDRSVQQEMDEIRQRQRQTALEQRTPRKQAEIRSVTKTNRVAAVAPGGPAAASDVSPLIAVEAAPAPAPAVAPLPRSGELQANLASAEDTTGAPKPQLTGSPPVVKKSRPRSRQKATVQRAGTPSRAAASSGNFAWRNVFER